MSRAARRPLAVLPVAAALAVALGACAGAASPSPRASIGGDVNQLPGFGTPAPSIGGDGSAAPSLAAPSLPAPTAEPSFAPTSEPSVDASADPSGGWSESGSGAFTADQATLAAAYEGLGMSCSDPKPYVKAGWTYLSCSITDQDYRYEVWIVASSAGEIGELYLDTYPPAGATMNWDWADSLTKDAADRSMAPADAASLTAFGAAHHENGPAATVAGFTVVASYGTSSADATDTHYQLHVSTPAFLAAPAS